MVWVKVTLERIFSVAKKWKFEWCSTDLDSWVEPPKQTQTYSGDHWNVRFGWIITEEGLTSCLITREAIGPGLASAKEPRLPVSTTLVSPLAIQISVH
jgi:hypothetical protein